MVQGFTLNRSAGNHLRMVQGFTLIELLVVVIFLAMVAALLVPAMSRATRYSKLELCRANMATLYEAQDTYFKGEKHDASLRGSELWIELATGTAPIIAKSTLICPLVESPNASPVQYWGPSSDVTQMSPDDKIGCDDIRKLLTCVNGFGSI